MEAGKAQQTGATSVTCAPKVSAVHLTWQGINACTPARGLMYASTAVHRSRGRTAAMRMNADTQFKELTPAQNVRQPLSKSAISTSIDARTRMKGCINARSAAPPSPDNTAATGTSGHSILAVISAVPSFLIGTP